MSVLLLNEIAALPDELAKRDKLLTYAPIGNSPDVPFLSPMNSATLFEISSTNSYSASSAPDSDPGYSRFGKRLVNGLKVAQRVPSR
jgi:hypothetical protein